MYLDFLLLIADYFRTLNKKVFIYEWLLPLILAVGMVLLFTFRGLPTITETFNNNVIRLLAVLVGFSITIVIILTTGHSRNLEEIKKTKTKATLHNKKVSLFRLLIINFTYAVVVEIGLILICLIYPFIINKVVIPDLAKIIGFSILFMMIVHVLLLNIRNLTDFCLIITKEK